MRRREFIALGAAVGLWPVVARAQQQPTIPVIGYLDLQTPGATAPFLCAGETGKE